MQELRKSANWIISKLPGLEQWSLQRSPHRMEAEKAVRSGKYTLAEEHLRAAVEEAEQRSAPLKFQVQMRLEMAEVQRLKALVRSETNSKADSRLALDMAEETLRSALILAARANDPRLFVRCKDALAELLVERGRPDAVEQVQEAIRVSSTLPEADPESLAKRARLLGLAYRNRAQLAPAIQTMEEALRLYEHAYGMTHMATAGLLVELGKMLHQRRDYRKAAEILERAFRIHQSEAGLDSREVQEDLAWLGAGAEAMGNTSAAAAHYERALTLKMRKLGTTNLDEVAEMQFSLAKLYGNWGNLGRARELMAESVCGFSRNGGPQLAQAYAALARLEEQDGRYQVAADVMEHACRTWEKCGAERARDLASSLSYRANLLAMLRREGEASWLRDRAAELVARTTPVAGNAAMA